VAEAPVRPEVALAQGDSGDAAVAGVTFADEPFTARYLVTGAGEGARLQLSLTDLYGKTLPLPELAAGAGELDLAAVVGEQLGAFRLEGRVLVDGEIVSPVAELILNRLPRPRHWGEDAPDSPFGVHVLSTTRHLTMAKAVGINWTRLHDAGLQYIGWWMLEPKPGEWRFFDREIHRYRDHQLRILGELGTAPAWASHYSKEKRGGDFGYWDKFFQPKDLADYRHYVATVIKRYDGVIEAWDVWNEPWIHSWWAVDFDPQVMRDKGFKAAYVTSEEPQKDFVAMMEAARETARDTGSNATILGFNTTAGVGTNASKWDGGEWSAGVHQHGGLEHCDALAYHQYTGDAVGHPGDSVERGLDHALGIVRRDDGSFPKPVWMTEGNSINRMIGHGLHRHSLAWDHSDDYARAGDRLAKYVLSLVANGVDRVFLYSMHSFSGLTGEERPWGTIVDADGSLHPCGIAHAVLAWHIEGRDLVEVAGLGGGAYAYAFGGSDGSVLVLSNEAEYQGGVAVPADPAFTARDLWGNGVPAGTPFTGQLLYLESGLAAADALQLLTP
jgi:hypothetical protein